MKRALLIFLLMVVGSSASLVAFTPNAPSASAVAGDPCFGDSPTALYADWVDDVETSGGDNVTFPLGNNDSYLLFKVLTDDLGSADTDIGDYFLYVAKDDNSLGVDPILFKKESGYAGIRFYPGSNALTGDNHWFYHIDVVEDNINNYGSSAANNNLSSFIYLEDWGLPTENGGDICLADYGGTVPPVYDASWTDPEYGSPIPQQHLWPLLSLTTDENNTILTSWDDCFSTENGAGTTVCMTTPDYLIFTLTDEADVIIDPTVYFGPYPKYEGLPDGNYRMRLDVVYLDPPENTVFETTQFYFTLEHKNMAIFWNSNELKFCSVRDGYEWNCAISQPGDETIELITGDPEEWVDEECTLEEFPWIDLGACIRNGLHYLGEYLGINGPSVTPGASPFITFDTNTFGLTSIIAAPLAMLNTISTSGYACEAIDLPMPFVGEDLVLPCLTEVYEDHFGGVFDVYQTVVTGVIGYFVIVGILNTVKGFKDPENDKIEVLKL